jgi:hypothetical protein
MSIIVRLLGLAAFLAAARAAWLHHQDNQLVIRTDLVRDAFAAGQAAERTRAAEAADTARRASYLGPAELITPAEADRAAKELLERLTDSERSVPVPPWSAGWSTTYSPGSPPTLTVLPPDVDGVGEPEGRGRDDFGDGHGGTS